MGIGSFLTWVSAAPGTRGFCVPGRRCLAAALICLSAGTVEAQLIDTFTFPEPTAVDGYFIFALDEDDLANITTLTDATALGGDRGVSGQASTPGFEQSASYGLTEFQQFQVDNGTSDVVRATLLYGFAQLGNEDLGGNPVGDPTQEAAVDIYDFDLLPADYLDHQEYDAGSAFSFDYQSNAEATVSDVRVFIVSGNDTFTTGSLQLIGAPSGATFIVPFSTFLLDGATPATFGSIDQIVFSFGGISANSVLTIDNLMVTSVPEPVSWAMLGMAGLLGWGGVMLRKRCAAASLANTPGPGVEPAI